eukprot:scaffold70971_cov74-Phaeocystis_antarctica.AAC.5
MHEHAHVHAHAHVVERPRAAPVPTAARPRGAARSARDFLVSSSGCTSGLSPGTARNRVACET